MAGAREERIEPILNIMRDIVETCWTAGALAHDKKVGNILKKEALAIKDDLREYVNKLKPNISELEIKPIKRIVTQVAETFEKAGKSAGDPKLWRFLNDEAKAIRNDLAKYVKAKKRGERNKEVATILDMIKRLIQTLREVSMDVIKMNPDMGRHLQVQAQRIENDLNAYKTALTKE